jgi:hypothetical protein
MVTSLPTPADAQAAIWTVRCRIQCRRQLDRQDVRTIVLPSSSRIPARAARAVSRLLRRRQNQCLSNALIVQAWRADHGDEVDVVIGVTAPSAGFSAHAWLADAPEAAAIGHQPIYRLPPHRQLSPARD